MPPAILAGILALLALASNYEPLARPAVAPELVVVIPAADGHVGTVVVERDGERLVLNRAYAASRIEGVSGPQAMQLDGRDVGANFQETLAALPPRPATFLLYFVTGSDELTEESKVELARMRDELRRRVAPDILVIGHTDRVGGVEANDQLSLQRAQRVKADLAASGIPADRIRAAGRGEREPLVATPDGVDEPRNRRVEINVR